MKREVGNPGSVFGFFLGCLFGIVFVARMDDDFPTKLVVGSIFVPLLFGAPGYLIGVVSGELTALLVNAVRGRGGSDQG